MGHWRHRIILFSLIFTACFCYSNGCIVEGSFPPLPSSAWIKDVYRGTFWQNQTTGIEGLHTFGLGELTSNRPYISGAIVSNRFELSTTALFDQYEENEVSHIMAISVTFICTGGAVSSPPLPVIINVIDTNNNPPTFLLPPSGEFVFTIATPVPPGFEVTGCFYDLIVRDIDLTTQKIIFEIEDNPYFEIEKEIKANPATPKDFKAILRTKTFIRSIPEPMRLTIFATDSDLTGDPSRTKETTITIVGNADFVLPEEPVFSETFYLADYTDDNRVVLTEPITLNSGYDSFVKFNIEGDFSENFELVPNPDQENQRSISVVIPLEGDVLRESNINLIVTADREHTSGASATVILRLPEVLPLEFQTAHYEGTIEDNYLRVPQLILSQGYAGETVTATVINEHSSHFTANVQGNTVTLSMRSLDESIINENSFLNLEIVATNGHSNTTAIVTLEIIKDDNVTPVFNKPIYIGSYDPDSLTLEQIVLVQGHGGIDSVDLFGDNNGYFKAELNGATVTIEVSEPIPPEIYRKERIVLSLKVEKPRTVGASATIIINLPAVLPLEFQTAHYEGTIEDNYLRVPQLILSQGYAGETVTATVINEHSSHFTANVQGNTVTLSMRSLEESIINENSFLNLEIVATNGHSTTTAIVTLKIIKNDNVTPVFNKPIYIGSYDPDGLTLEQIVLIQGHGGIDSVDLFGDNNGYFKADLNGATVTIEVSEPIPPEIYRKERIVLSLEVEKPRTVGASATIIINLPAVLPLEFQTAHYEGTIEDNYLRVPQLILSQGYAGETVTATVINEHSSYFSTNVQGNTVTLSMRSLDESIINENSFLNLEIVATNGHSTTTAIVTLEIIKDDNVTPVFNKPIYIGSYDPDGLTIEQIVLVQGHGGIDAVDLFGDYKGFFKAELSGATVTIEVSEPIPPEMYRRERIVLSLEVEKPRTVGASATIIINLPAARELKFGASTYRGSLQDNVLTLDPIPLTVGYDSSVVFTITGDSAANFRVTNDQNPAIISLVEPIPSGVISENKVVILTLAASGLNAVTTTTSVLLDIIKDDTMTPVFSKNIYYGTYSGSSNFNINDIFLIRGFDSGVTFSLGGDHAQFFQISNTGNEVTVVPRASGIPEDVIFTEKVLVFNVLAAKALTVGASAAISIRFPSDLTDRVIMRFSQNTYTGTIGSSGLTADSIVLSSGYAPGTEFILTGDYVEHFTLTPNSNVVSLSLTTPLPIDATENTFILLEIEARRAGAVSDRTSVVIDISSQETIAPVFTQAYYRGAYNAESGLQFNQVISLENGYDETVSFSLDGEFSSLFDLDPRDTNSFSIVVSAPITNEVLQANNQFLLTVVATKPGALTARSAVFIDIEKDLTDRVIMRFSQNTYTGTIGSSGLTADSIVLSSGYAPGTEFILTGDYVEHFTLTPNSNVVSLSLTTPLPIDATENTFILLEIEARRAGAVSDRTSVVIDIISQETIAPVFTQAYYRGAYSAESGLQFNQVISLENGYDETVSFSLDGEFSSLFDLDPRDTNSFSIVVSAPITNEVLQANNQFLLTVVATKPGALTARSAVFIDIEKDLTDRVIMRFSQNTYTGTIGSSGLTADSIVLSSGYAPGTEFILTGDYVEHFTLTPNSNVVSLSLTTPLPIDATENTFILLDIEARRAGAVSDRTSVVIDIISQETIAPVFTQAYYRGAYNAESGLQFNQVISLENGYDETVSFSLDGEFSSLFDLDPRDTNSFSIVVSAPITNEVLQANNQFLLTVVATKPGALAARSAVFIDIEKDLTDRVIMRFSQNTYTGTIGSSGLTADSIVLSSGYAPGTEFILTGDYVEHFTLTPNSNVVSLSLTTPLPIDATENTFILLEIEARRAGAVSDRTSVVIDIISQETIAPVFTQAYYRGAYSAESGLQFNQVISLENGYDETVSFSLDGEFSSLFDLDPRDTNSFSIVVSAPITNEVLQANNQFLLTVVATKPGALTARSAVFIDIEKDLTDRVIMRFSQNTYTGTIGSSGLTADSIVLSSGYAPGTEFILTGDYVEHFTLTPNSNVVSLSLTTPLPIDATENTFILLEIEARRAGAVSDRTSVVIDIISQETIAPVFTQAYYRGAYNAESGLQFNQVISLENGYDETVSFSLDGEFSSLFDLDPRDTNSFSIVVSAPITNEVLQANNQFLLTVVATKPGALAARSAVFIDIEKDLTDRVIMRFSQNTYTGTIGSSGLTADSIVLSSGYAPGTEFILTGDYVEHFTLTPNSNVVSLSLTTPLPIDATENTFILLEIEARRAGAVSDRTSVVIDIISQETIAPVFTQAYYRGAYNAESGLQFNQVISLENGYDETVSFSLDGEFSSLFDLDPRDTNSFSIVVSAPITNEVLQANNQFLLTVVATKPGALAARSAVFIDIEKDLTDRVIMRFSQNTYTGTIGSSGLTADSIVLSSGYAPGTEFILTGDYVEHFTLTPNSNVVSLSLTTPLPIDATENTFILLEIEARRAGAVSDRTSVVIDIISQETIAPVFTQAYYRGAYSAESGLQFNQVISLENGYDETVSFSLDGEFSSLFDLDPRDTNSFSIVVSAPITNEVLQANNQFLLTVVATKPGALTARSAVFIDIEKDLTDRVIMRFSQNTYTGTIGSSGLTADSIVLSSGYAPGTEFILTGDYVEHFTLTPNSNVVSLSLTTPLPIDATENTFILLEIEARRAGAVSDRTSVVIDIISQETIAPVFTQAYYRGAYSAESGLQFNQVISLENGYDETVSFSLDGEFSSLFDLDPRDTNSFSIVVSAPITNEVLQANNQFLLTVVATKPGALTARSAVFIDIEKDLTDRVIMRFSQNTYTGTIGSSGLTADSIVLSSGYAPGTEFILTGDYVEHFTLTPNSNVVSLSLTTPLPIDATENTFILLDIEARRAGAVSDRTSVVIDIISQETIAPVFTQAYYRGAYNAESGLQFNQVISLENGYDETVSFSLDGEFSSLFDLDPRDTNSFSIVVSAPITNEVLQANNQFLLIVVATKPGALAARSAVFIDIEKDLTDRVIMRFSQNTYTGTIGSSGLTADSIVLSSGYAPGTEFILTGDYVEHFTLTPNSNVVSLSLTTPLPIDATENTFILLEIEARRAGAVSDRTSVVIDIISQETIAPVFTQAYYRGAYSAESGLQFNQVISLENGYDETVSFSLDGEFSSLFDLDPRDTNSFSIVVSAPITNEVLQANNQFLLTVVATKPGALTARSAVFIDIEKDLTDRVIMRFSQNTYTGTIGSSGLTADSIVLSSGYAPGTEFILTGDYVEHFTLTPNSNVVSLSLTTPLPIDATENTFILLDIEARRAGAVSDRTSVVIDIISQETIAPVFTQAYYRGAYNAESGLQFNQVISLENGYDETVSFSLDGEFSSLFDLDPRDTNSFSIVVSAPITNEVLQANNQFLLIVVATKPGALAARSAVFIDIEKDLTDRVIMRFSQNTYTGTIGSSGLTADSIVLSSGYAPGTEFILTGDYVEHFTLTPNSNVVSLSLTTPLPIDATENTFILLEIEARRAGAVSDRTSVVIDIISQETIAPVFTQAYYRGAYSAESGLQFNQVISLENGYDETVSFSLDGEFSSLFDLDPRDTNSFSIVVSAPITNEVLQANNQFLLTVVATKPGALTARSAVFIDIEKDLTDRVIMRFSQNTYTGTIGSSGLTADSIVLSSGYAPGTEFILTGDYVEHFTLTPNSNVVSLSLTTPLPIDATENTFILLEIEARRAGAVSDRTSVVIDIISQETIAPVFTQAYYRGAYNAESGLQFNQVISLENGYDETVSFSLDGEFSSLFDLDPRDTNSFSIVVSAPITNEVLQANNQFLLTVVATKPGALAARSAVFIDIEKDLTDRVIMRFSQNTYTGTIGSSGLTADSIVLSSGYAPGTEFILTGDYVEHFTLTPNSNVVSLSLTTPLPIDATENTFILLEIEARRAGAVSDRTSVVIDIISQETIAPVFTQAYYRGAYNAESGLQFNQVISLENGYDETVSFSLDGEFSSLFDLDPRDTNSFSIVVSAPITNEVLQANNQFLLTVVATKPGALAARSAVFIDIEKDLTDRVIMRFSQNTYTGTIGSSGLTADSIVLSSGYAPGTEFILTGDYVEHFTLTPNSNVVSLSLTTPLPIDATENTFILLEIEARRAGAVSDRTSVVIDIISQETIAPVFTQAYYRGAYSAESGLQFNQVISLENGYDETVSFSLDGEFSSLFDLDPRDTNSFSIVVSAPITNEVLQANNQFLLTVVATKPGALTARSAVFIDIEKDSQTDDVSFERVLYRGDIQLDEIQHDLITIAGYEGTSVAVVGEYSIFFEGHVLDGEVRVQIAGSLTLPANVTNLALELHAAGARAVLLLDVLQADVPLQPSVTFSSESYALSVGMAQTGLVGRVSATTDNGEAVIYSLGTDDAHLLTRLSISNEGELHLSAPANSGVYTFQVIATTVDTRATGKASVHLTVQAITVCDDQGTGMAPLVILDRNEEAAHNNLVVLDSTLHAGCHFTLTNRWPTNQPWLYVDENGLHTIPIDREHESIAFMALSQVQVELTLHCESDSATREKRSERTDRLGPYDYGSNKWILTDSIPYNPSRSLVNLIVNDINDNYPIFVGKEHEPTVVGYPTAELEERILPRSLAELKATDADTGINAALRYSSSESVLAVAPTTGFVHVRTGAQLQHNQLLQVTATDKNGQGLNGTIELVVKLLDFNHIAVVTIRDAFLDDETTVLTRLSDAIGYEVKTLRSVVISDDIHEGGTRNKRETGTSRASLQLYVYGINEREPVPVDKLAADITTNAAMASVIRTIPLEDHLEDKDQIGLLVATIILGVLLFAVILLVAIWFFLRWRKNKTYDEFNEENSTASRNASLGELPKPEVVQPRLNIEDLKKSEKRLQEMLQAPIEDVTVEPMMRRTEARVEAVLDLPILEPSAPIVIQSIDKLKDAEEFSDDEFGEISAKPRKSVVTFNENVEKIIHVEDNIDDDDVEANINVDALNSGFEIYRL